MAKRDLFDKRFVIGATVLGAVYALIVALIGRFAGKDAANVAGVALTALATALFQKFETLQFRKISDENLIHVDVPPINLWRVLTITLTFVGAEYLFGVASALLPESWLGGWQLPVLFVGVLLTYFVAPILVARAFVNLRYSTVAFAVLLTQIVSFLVALVRFRPVVAEVFNESGPAPAIGVQGALCLVFEIVALVGVRLGLGSRLFSEKSKDSPSI